MKFKDNFKGFVCGCIITLLMSSVVYASPIKQSIEVIYDDIKIFVDGVEKAPAGDLRPFIYNGRTYVPLRFAGELLGKRVSWDGANKKINIDDPSKTDKQLKDVYLFKNIDGTNALSSIIFDDNTMNIVFKNISSAAYIDGKLQPVDPDGLYHRKYYITYDLKGMAKRLAANLTGSADINGGLTVKCRVYDENDKVLYESPMQRDQSARIEIDADVKNVSVVKVELEVASGSQFANNTFYLRNLRIQTTDY